MFVKKMFFSLALLLAVSGASVAAQEAQGEGRAQAERRAQTELARAFAIGGSNHLGVSVESVTRENMASFNLRGEPRGVAVREVLPDSPAAKAGLQKNDVILRFDGEAVASVQKLQRLINESAPEHAARLSISRNGSEQELTVTLARRQNFSPRAFESFNFPGGQTFNFDTEDLKRRAEELARNSEEWKRHAQEWEKNSQEMRRNLEKFRGEDFKGFGENFTLVYGGGGRRIGIQTQTLTGQLADYFGVSDRGGLLVTSVAEGSPAAKAGLKAGDVVTEVDGTGIKTAGELSRALSRRNEGDVTLTVMRERKSRTIKVTPERSENPTLLAPEGGVGFVAPMALSGPRRVNIAPMRPLRLTAPRRPSAAPRIYAAPPAAPAAPLAPVRVRRPGTWVL